MSWTTSEKWLLLYKAKRSVTGPIHMPLWQNYFWESTLMICSGISGYLSIKYINQWRLFPYQSSKLEIRFKYKYSSKRYKALRTCMSKGLSGWIKPCVSSLFFVLNSQHWAVLTTLVSQPSLGILKCFYPVNSDLSISSLVRLRISSRVRPGKQKVLCPQAGYGKCLSHFNGQALTFTPKMTDKIMMVSTHSTFKIFSKIDVTKMYACHNVFWQNIRQKDYKLSCVWKAFWFGSFLLL